MSDARTEGQVASGVARRATPDPDRFVIPLDQAPPGFAERLERTDVQPVEPRPASTVVLMREASDGLEALLLRRHRRSGFAAGAWVFPGGTVDAVDRDPALPVLCDGPPPESWGERLGLGDAMEAFGYVAAAVREAFEETGILLARRSASGTSGTASDARLERSEEYRGALLAGELSLRAIAAREGLRYATGELIYIGHWVTPEPEPRRYDTRFFLAPVPPDAEGALHEPELTEARWLSAAAAVEGFMHGELSMLPPTVHTLRRLAPFATLVEARLALADAPVPRILPRMRRSEQGIVIEIAADPPPGGAGQR